jgi:hypothetical protein
MKKLLLSCLFVLSIAVLVLFLTAFGTTGISIQG